MSEVTVHSPEIQPAGEVEVSPSIPGVQPEPLEELSADERIEWYKFTKRMPGDWFPPETWPMLAQLCRHICHARWLGQSLQEARAGLLDPSDEDGLEKVERIGRMHNTEGRAITALMVRLRLTSQQRIPDADVADRARERLKHEAPERDDAPPWAVSGRQIAAGTSRRQ